MPILLGARISKKDIPDREMQLSLDAAELEKFLEIFPGFKNLDIPSYEPSEIQVVVKVSAFLKKPDQNADEKKD